jgi:hypothetical protein
MLDFLWGAVIGVSLAAGILWAWYDWKFRKHKRQSEQTLAQVFLEADSFHKECLKILDAHRDNAVRLISENRSDALDHCALASKDTRTP